MMRTTDHSIYPPRREHQTTATASQVLAELRAIRKENARLAQLFDTFAGAYLNARFPFGDGSGDRWPRRRTY